jgi:DNA-binding response OmpR family regulator
MTALLLAEPEASMRGFLERQLSSDGFDVLAFSRIDELPRAAEPDVLVLGDPDALDRCLVTGCPVIVLGSADAETRLRALELCDDYLARPFVYEELVGSISPSRFQLDFAQPSRLCGPERAPSGAFLAVAAHETNRHTRHTPA